MPRFLVFVSSIVVSTFCSGQVVLLVYGLVHRNYLAAVLNLIGAGINFNVLYRVIRVYRRNVEAERAVQQAERDVAVWQAGVAIRSITGMFSQEAIDRAEKNLKKIVRAVGATEMGTAHAAYMLQTPSDSFCVYAGHVYRKYRNTFGGEDGTCYHTGSHMPPAELIGTALLLLHRDPSLYERWKRQDGYYK